MLTAGLTKLVTNQFLVISSALRKTKCNQRVVFICATAATAVARLSHRNSVYRSVCHAGGSVKNGAS